MKLSKQEFNILIETLKNMRTFSNDVCKAFDVKATLLDAYLATMFALLVRLCGYDTSKSLDNPYVIKYLFEDEPLEGLYEKVCEEVKV